MISYKLQTLNYSEDMNELLCEIDDKLSKMSQEKLNSERFGFVSKSEPKKFNILFKYRGILTKRISFNRCFKKYILDDMINFIKQYLYHGKVSKINLSPSDSTVKIDLNPFNYLKNGVNVQVLHQHYGDHIVYNSVHNKFITEDSWDQTDW